MDCNSPVSLPSLASSQVVDPARLSNGGKLGNSNVSSVYLDQLMSNFKLFSPSFVESVYAGLPKSVTESVSVYQWPAWMSFSRPAPKVSTLDAMQRSLTTVQYNSESTSQQKTGGYHSDERSLSGSESQADSEGILRSERSFSAGMDPSNRQNRAATTAKDGRLATLRQQKNLVIQPVPDAPPTIAVTEIESEATDLRSTRDVEQCTGTKYGFIYSPNEYFAGREYAQMHPVHPPNTPEAETGESVTKKYSLKSFTPFTKLVDLYQKISGRS